MTKTKGDATRAQVIEGAIRVLSATGVIGATTRKIAAESGVRLATLHYHFDSKSALLLAVFEALIDETMLAFREEVKDSTGLDDCIEQVLKAAWRWIMQTRVLQIVQYELTLYALREGAQWLADQQYDAYVRVYRDFLIAVSEKTGELSPAGCTAVDPLHAGRRGRAAAAGTGQTQSSAIEARDRGPDPGHANLRPLAGAGARTEFAIDKTRQAAQAGSQKRTFAGMK